MMGWVVAILVIAFLWAAIDAMTNKALSRFADSDAFGVLVFVGLVSAVAYWAYN